MLCALAALAPAATFIVGNTADSGAGSFRDALNQANSDGEASSIDFAPVLAGQTIVLANLLPNLTEAGTTIDGDLDDDCSADIGIDGSAVGPGGPGLWLQGGGHTIRGLALFGFQNDGTLRINSDGNVVECSLIGVRLDGAAVAPGGGQAGIEIQDGNDNRVGPGNTIANHNSAGVRVVEFSTSAYPEFAGLTPDLIAVFDQIAFDDSQFGFRRVGGPLLVDALGRSFTENFGMRLRGTLTVASAGSYSFTADPLDDNLRLRVDGNVLIDGNGPGPLVGNLVLGVGAHSFVLEFAEGGGWAALTLAIAGPAATSFSTDGQPVCAGAQPGLCGELFRTRMPAERNRITGNRIHGTGGKPIALDCCMGPLPNDPGDIDIGANGWLNRPVLEAVQSSGGGNYTISGSAPANATIEVFESITHANGAGGSGSLRASFSAGGDGSFNAPIPLQANPGVLTATATDAAGNTSEFSANFAYGGSDAASLGNAAGVAGSTVQIPIRVRDVALTPLGRDRPAGERIQGLAFRVDFAPAAVTGGSIVPAGIAATLTPVFGPSSSYTAGSVNYLVAYAEASNLIPFNLDAAAPGDVVAMLQLQLAPAQAPGNVVLTLNAASSLSNQAGTISESTANGGLTLAGGSIAVSGNAPSGLYARALSANSVRLRWNDPNLIETGFRIQRSADGNSYTDVQDVGADVTSFDDGGRSAGTLYYYRVLTLVGALAGGASNRATATTFPAVAAQVCIDPATTSRRWARSPDVVHTGSGWSLVYHAREDGSREQVYFQRLHDSTLAPLAPPVQLSNSATGATLAGLGWNGSHHAAIWLDQLRGAPGSPPVSGLRFLLFDADGTPRRGPRRLGTQPLGFLNLNEIVRPHWDGSHWGVFYPQLTLPFSSSVQFRRLAENGDTVVGPSAVHTSATHYAYDLDVAWQPLSGEYGLVFVSQQNDGNQILFQRVEESSGVAQLGVPAVIDSATGWDAYWGTSIVADPAGGWLIAWVECDVAGTECPAYTRRISPAGVPDAGGAVRVSPAAAGEERPRLVRRSGGYALFVDTFPQQQEVARYLLNAAGAADGSPAVPVSAFDGRASGRSRAASDGSRTLTVWSDATTTLEVAARLAAGDGSLGSIVALTSGHSPGNTTAVIVPGQPRVAVLGGGVVAAWPENASGQNLVHARIYNASGALQGEFAPLSATPASNRPGLAAVGQSFAVAWRSNTGQLRFARYASDGSVLVPELIVADGVGGGPVELGWDGEHYAAVFAQGGNYRFTRIAADGTVVTPHFVLPLGAIGASAALRIEWLGEGWALAWRNAQNGGLLYARIGADGSALQLPIQFAVPIPPFGASGDLSIAYDGNELGVAWAAFVGTDPPFNELYFTVVNRDGSSAFAPVAIHPGDLGTTPPQLHVAPGGFRLVYLADNEHTVGMRELSLERVAGGVNIVASRFLANRGSGSAATAHDGAGLAMAWRMGPTHDIHIETDACLADVSPPPCPELALAAANHSVRLTWPAVADPESGLWRHHVYRDGFLLAELPAAAMQFDDSGYDSATIHAYQVRAMNRAFAESVACPVRNFSTTVGDANGNGTLEVADIFYLINFLLASGPPPAGDADANGDGSVSVADIFFIINYFFGGGPPPTGVDGG
ncbi:MAG: hypothetical protein DYH17_08625 [Xanthomonadales bacterium PRO6]|nr:hypothetical protein [Xanthomonadales bacterium PRO6]